MDGEFDDCAYLAATTLRNYRFDTLVDGIYTTNRITWNEVESLGLGAEQLSSDVKNQGVEG